MRNVAKEEYIFKEALSQVMLQKKQVLIRVNSCNQGSTSSFALKIIKHRQEVQDLREQRSLSCNKRLY